MICVFVWGGNRVEYRKWKNKFAYAGWSMISNEPVQVGFQVGFLSVSVCAWGTHIFISRATASRCSKLNQFCANPKVIWTQECLYAAHENTLKGLISLALMFTNQLFSSLTYNIFFDVSTRQNMFSCIKCEVGNAYFFWEEGVSSCYLLRRKLLSWSSVKPGPIV